MDIEMDKQVKKELAAVPDCSDIWGRKTTQVTISKGGRKPGG
jgi:hypothetical protein